MKRIAFFLFVFLSVNVNALFAQDIIMTNTSVVQGITEDSRAFYDPGGQNGDFGLGIRDTLTMRNSMSGQGTLSVIFDDFAMGYGDTLYVFDSQTCDPNHLIGFYNSVNSPEEVSTVSGYLTFVFHSDSIHDYGMLKSGWVARAYVTPANPDQLWLNSDNQGLTMTSCNFKFYDSGGPGNMTTNTGTVWCELQSPVSHVKPEFQSFNVAGVMKIYDGQYYDPNKRLIGQWHSTTVGPAGKPPVLFSSGNTLTVEYVSAAGDMNKPGWEATVSCVTELFESPDGSACPSVVSQNELGEDLPDTLYHTCGVPIILSAKVTATGRYTNDYTVKSIPFNPPYPFTAGTSCNANDDDSWLAQVSLGFTFSFFGNNYTTVYPGTNAIISLEPRLGSCNWRYGTPPANPPYTNISGNQTQGHPYNYENAIYGVYHDVHCAHYSNGGAVRKGVLGEYPCRSFVFNYDHIALFGNDSEQGSTPNESDNGYYNTYQMVMYEGTNIIDIYVKHCSKGQTATSIDGKEGVIGLHNKSSSQILLAPGRGPDWWVNPGNPPNENIKKNQANDEAWRFTPITPMDEAATIDWFANTVSDSTCVGHSKKLVVDPQDSTDYIVRYHFTNAGNNPFDLYDTVHVIVTVPKLSLDTFTVCPGKTVKLEPIYSDTTEIHPESFLWNTSDTTDTLSIRAMQTQEYELTVLFDNNCRRTARTVVNVDTMAIPHISGDSVICYGDQARLVAQVDSPTYVLRWGNGYEGDVLVVRPTDTSTYVVKAIEPSDEECFTTDTITVVVLPLPELSFTYSPESVVIERGVGTLTCFTDCDPDYNIVWNFNDRYNPETSIIEDLHSVTHDFTHVGSYDVTLSATNQYECRDSVTEHVRVYVPVSFMVPNAFTPNDDGLNDYFIPVYEGVELAQYLMLVYDRAGRLVFKSTNPTVGWDGRDFNGQLCPQGVYTYYIHHWTQMDDLRGTGQPAITGGVTLIR